jgi:hypothetical protein
MPRCAGGRGACETLLDGVYLRILPELWADMEMTDAPIAYRFDLCRDAAATESIRPLHRPPHGDWWDRVASFHDLEARQLSEWGPYREVQYRGGRLTLRILEYELGPANVAEPVLKRLGWTRPLLAFRRFSALVTLYGRPQTDE